MSQNFVIELTWRNKTGPHKRLLWERLRKPESKQVIPHSRASRAQTLLNRPAHIVIIVKVLLNFANESVTPQAPRDGQGADSNRPALLFVDLLGVRARWHSGGRAAAETAFKDFRNVVAASLKGLLAGDVVDGLIETDAVALTCKNVATALAIGQRLYGMVFRQTQHNRERRYWLRGVIVPRAADEPLRRVGAFAGRLAHISLVHYESELFDAIAIEKSGLKGMRLLVDRSLITPEISREYRIPHENLWFIPFKHLRDSYYPRNISETHLDYLWMASEKAEDRRSMEILMSQRLRLASHDPEELLQAAATQVVFHEYAAMIGSLDGRLKYQRERKARQRIANTGR